MNSKREALVGILIIFLLTVLVGVIIVNRLDKQEKASYPKYLYNPCINKWAVKVDKNHWLAIKAYNNYGDAFSAYFHEISIDDTGKTIDLVLGTKVKYKLDTVLWAPFGQERQFNDSLLAVYSYIRAKGNQDRARHYADSVSLSAKQIAIEAKRYGDSVYKCQHTYK